MATYHRPKETQVGVLRTLARVDDAPSPGQSEIGDRSGPWPARKGRLGLGASAIVESMPMVVSIHLKRDVGRDRAIERIVPLTGKHALLLEPSFPGEADPSMERG